MHIQILRVTTRNTKIFNFEIIVGGREETWARKFDQSKKITEEKHGDYKTRLTIAVIKSKHY